MPEAARHAMGLLPTSVAQSNPAPGNGGAGQTTGLGSSLHRVDGSAPCRLYFTYGLNSRHSKHTGLRSHHPSTLAHPHPPIRSAQVARSCGRLSRRRQ